MADRLAARLQGTLGHDLRANLRLKLAEMDEAQWLAYSANLRTRPLMPDFALRAMREDDRRALYRFVHSLGPAGVPAPAYFPPVQALVRPTFDTASSGGGRSGEGRLKRADTPAWRPRLKSVQFQS